MTKSIKPLILAILGLSVLLIILQFFQNEIVYHRTNISEGQWWRIITGNLIHSNYTHLALNLAGLWILGFLFIDSLKIKTFIFSIVFLCLIVGTGLYIYTPELDVYYGFSGVLYGLFLIGAFSAILQHDYFTGISVALLLFFKVAWDLFKGGSLTSEKLIGIPVATDAHLYGVLGASLTCCLILIKTRLMLKTGGGAM